MQQNPLTLYRATEALETVRAQGRSVAWVARKIGLSRQYTSDILHGHRSVSPAIAQRVADTLDVPLFLLFKVSDGSNVLPEGIAA